MGVAEGVRGIGKFNEDTVQGELWVSRGQGGVMMIQYRGNCGCQEDREV